MRPLPNHKFQWPMVPAVVCGVFSIEIGFKAIIMQKGGTATGHDLFKLFQKLSPAAQDLIVKEVGLDRAAFSVELNKISNAFVKWRYIYEKLDDSPAIGIQFLGKLAGATQKASAAPKPK